MATRCKMRVVRVQRYGVNDECARLELTAVTGGSPENESFWRATPSGRLELLIDNPAAVAALAPELGREYYLDLAPADPRTGG